MTHWDGREFFRASEFGDFPDRMDPAFISRLELSRAVAGVPFVITSAWRSEIESKSHWTGKAVDIRAKSSAHRMAIVSACMTAGGFTRVGVYYNTGHVHVDANTLEDGFPQNVLWVGEGRA